MRRKDEVFFFVRSGFTGTSKYAHSLWAGDQHVDFSKEFNVAIEQKTVAEQNAKKAENDLQLTISGYTKASKEYKFIKTVSEV